MISKHLAVAVAVAFLSAASAGHGLAQQTTNQPAATAPAPGAQPSQPAMSGPTAPDTAAAPGANPPDSAASPPPPAVNPPVTPAAPAAGASNPYGLYAFVRTGDFVIRGVVLILAIMSIGTWYIFFMKFWEQSKVLSHARVVERRFWSSANLNEGIDKLPKNSLFRSVAESGVRAASGQGTGLVNLNDWIADVAEPPA